MRLFPEVVLHDFLHHRDSSRTSDEYHFIDVFRLHACVGEGLLQRTHRLVDDVADELLELRARQRHGQMLRTGLIRGDERQIDVGRCGRGELDLCFFSGFLQPLQGHLVLRQIDALIFLELFDDPVDEALVDVVAAEVCVTVGRLDFHDALADFEDRNVERTAAEIVDGDGLVVLFVETIGERGRSGLVHQTLDFETGDLARVLSCLSLCVVEICGHSNDRAFHLLAEIVFRSLFQLLQDHRGDLRRRVQLSGHLNARISIRCLCDFVGHHLHLFAHFVELPTHEPLDGEDGVLGIGDCLALCHLPDEALSALGERHD